MIGLRAGIYCNPEIQSRAKKFPQASMVSGGWGVGFLGLEVRPWVCLCFCSVLLVFFVDLWSVFVVVPCCLFCFVVLSLRVWKLNLGLGSAILIGDPAAEMWASPLRVACQVGAALESDQIRMRCLLERRDKMHKAVQTCAWQCGEHNSASRAQDMRGTVV